MAQNARTVGVGLSPTILPAVGLPTFDHEGRTYLRRLTLVVDDGKITHVFYPVFPPDRHPEEVVAWLRAHPR